MRLDCNGTGFRNNTHFPMRGNSLMTQNYFMGRKNVYKLIKIH